MKRNLRTAAMLAGVLGISLLLLPVAGRAHCDTMDGPVVADARQALTAKDITPVLKWIPAENEAEIKEIFAKTLAVRQLNSQAQEIADRLFFETLVRIHRAGEGEPFTGLKPEGTAVDPVISLVDRALTSGAIDSLIGRINEHVDHSIRERFEQARQARDHAADSPEAGRKYVEAYVELMHFMERLHEDATADISHSDSHGQQESAH